MTSQSPELRRLLLELFEAGLHAVDGRRRVRDYLTAHAVTSPVYLIAVGKAACAMARGAHDVLGDGILDALVVTKDGHTEPLPWPVLEAGHPIPDARSLAAGDALLCFIDALPPTARVLVLLSGGASALVECLSAGVDLHQLQRVSDWLLSNNLDVVEMNRMRKHLSRIKGGRLATLLAPREVLCLAISDVHGDDPRSIGSGPLSGDDSATTTPLVLLPDFVRAAAEAATPTPRASDPCFTHVRVAVIARLADAMAATAAAATRRGYRVTVEDQFVAGDAVAAGERLAQTLLQGDAGVVHIWGGETTVRLPPQPGRGGRNQSLALAAALQLAGRDGVFFLSAGTDGTDGPTQDTGAVVDAGTIARGTAQGFDARDALSRADAGSFLEASGDLIHTGPTGTNVMDLMLGIRT